MPINGTTEELSHLQGVVNCELPNNMTNDFNGTVGEMRICHLDSSSYPNRIWRGGCVREYFY